MFQDGSDRLPTDSPSTLCATRSEHTAIVPQSASTASSTHQSNGPTGRAGPRRKAGTAGNCTSVRQRANVTRGYTTARLRAQLPSSRTSDRRRTGRGCRRAGKCTHRRRSTRETVRRSAHRTQPASGELNSDGRKRGPIRLPLYGFTYS